MIWYDYLIELVIPQIMPGSSGFRQFVSEPMQQRICCHSFRIGGLFAGESSANSLLAGDLGSGGQLNFGKVGNTSESPQSGCYQTHRLILADADQLGVDQNITFKEVSDLYDCKLTVYSPDIPTMFPDINALKKTTLLPLLYSEVFQRTNLVPPQGVLFHDAPETGETILTCTLTMNYCLNGKGICESGPSIADRHSYFIIFMCKGTGHLSKWVSEAE